MTKTEEKKKITEEKNNFLDSVAKCVLDFAYKLQKDGMFNYRLSYEKNGRNQYFHFLKYQQKVNILIYKNGNIALKEQGFEQDNEFQLFNYEESNELDREIFISDFKLFLKRFSKIYINPPTIYYGDEAKNEWDKIIEEKQN